MIIAIEGASAAGKTTWCRRFAAGRMVPEVTPDVAAMAPDETTDPAGAARFWSDANQDRWAHAGQLESLHDWVACDTDPFKLHWTWTNWQLGRAAKNYWALSRARFRDAFDAEKLGLADLVLFADPGETTLRAQKRSDTTRSRSRHDLHVALAPHLRRWYEAMHRLEPTRVIFQLPQVGLVADHLSLGQRAERTGVAIFDRLMSELEHS